MYLFQKIKHNYTQNKKTGFLQKNRFSCFVKLFLFVENKYFNLFEISWAAFGLQRNASFR